MAGLYSSAPAANQSVLVRLSDTVSALLKESVGGLVWLARVLHDRDGSLSVGAWQVLRGGWEHAETFFYTNGLERSFISPPRAVALDETRFLVALGIVDTGYVMVVRLNGDGTFSTGPAATFPSVGATQAVGSGSGPAFMVRHGPDRAVIIRREYKTIGGTTALWAPEAVIVSVSGMTASAGAPSTIPLLDGWLLAWSADDGTGWWGWSVNVVGSLWTTWVAWYREAGGVIDHGTPVALAPLSGASYPTPAFASIGGQRTLAVLSDPAAISTRVELFRRVGLDFTIEDTWTGVLGAPAGIAARQRQSVVDARIVSSSERRYRQLALAGEQYTLAEEAIYGYANTPPDQNAKSAGPTQFEWLSGSRLLALYTVNGVSDKLTGGTQDRNHVLNHRLMTMVVPPVCPPRYDGVVAGEPAMRVSEPTMSARVAPAAALTPTTARTPCTVGPAQLSGGSQRVHPRERR